jgi:hypothetical protein
MSNRHVYVSRAIVGPKRNENVTGSLWTACADFPLRGYPETPEFFPQCVPNRVMPGVQVRLFTRDEMVAVDVVESATAAALYSRICRRK